MLRLVFRRFDPSLRKLKTRVDTGEIGNILSIKSTARDSPFPPVDFLKISGNKRLLTRPTISLDILHALYYRFSTAGGDLNCDLFMTGILLICCRQIVCDLHPVDLLQVDGL